MHRLFVSYDKSFDEKYAQHQKQKLHHIEKLLQCISQIMFLLKDFIKIHLKYQFLDCLQCKFLFTFYAFC